MTHVLITGDTGTGSIYQKKVAKMIQEKEDEDTDGCILVGDNLYEGGATDVEDDQFEDKFEKIYKDCKSKFYLVLGNHDYGFEGDGRYRVQIEYSDHSEKWNMPDRYYHKEMGVCDFFMLDTNFEWMNESVIEKQYQDIVKMIKGSKNKWKIVCGHHTWRSVGGHGNAEKPFETFMRRLVDEVHIDMYVCGHDHCKNVIEMDVQKGKKKKIYCVVIGTGGKPYDDYVMDLKNMGNGSELLFHSPNLGICELKATSRSLSLEFFTYKDEGTCWSEYDIIIGDR